ncbi:ABC transporter permease [Actinomadura barringtoniae]|uniref:ABC transporter permease n=1 Tax=Actinomadura barringtoniae TaxID=1427535 RepID=A0A939PJ34_9ACTN|nr:ABC transporter permease [Actinomadura barringtoniae]MBO2453212.1 ABC transporter permease [Actinomadura barringtoniae]
MKSYRAELIRFVNRSSAAMILLCVGATLFSMSNAGPQHQTPLWGFRQMSILTATLLMGRAAVLASGDFSSGTIRAWLISRPNRAEVFSGKLAASLSFAVITSAATSLSCYALSGTMGAVPSVGAMLVAAGQLAFAAGVLTFFGHAAGVLTRSIPVALTLTLVWILPAEKGLQGHSGGLDAWLPGNVTQDITRNQLQHGMTPLGAALHAALPFIVLDAVALALFLRRDVNS